MKRHWVASTPHLKVYDLNADLPAEAGEAYPVVAELSRVTVF